MGRCAEPGRGLLASPWPPGLHALPLPLESLPPSQFPAAYCLKCFPFFSFQTPPLHPLPVPPLVSYVGPPDPIWHFACEDLALKIYTGMNWKRVGAEPSSPSGQAGNFPWGPRASDVPVQATAHQPSHYGATGETRAWAPRHSTRCWGQELLCSGRAPRSCLCPTPGARRAPTACTRHPHACLACAHAHSTCAGTSGVGTLRCWVYAVVHLDVCVGLPCAWVLLLCTCPAWLCMGARWPLLALAPESGITHLGAAVAQVLRLASPCFWLPQQCCSFTMVEISPSVA